jgi:cobalamin biosynthesis protein CobT
MFMKVTSYTKLNTYEVDGNDLAIYWDEQEHEPKEDETEVYWTYDHAQAFASDSRNVLIEKIMATKYPTYGAEVAAICNGGDSAAKHEAFRAEAKTLADGWVNKE